MFKNGLAFRERHNLCCDVVLLIIMSGEVWDIYINDICLVVPES